LRASDGGRSLLQLSVLRLWLLPQLSLMQLTTMVQQQMQM